MLMNAFTLVENILMTVAYLAAALQRRHLQHLVSKSWGGNNMVNNLNICLKIKSFEQKRT